MTHARKNRYNILCYIVAHDKKQPDYEDDESSIGDRIIAKNVISEALEELGANFNFIEVWLKLLEDNYYARRVAYITAMKEMLKKIPTMMTKPLIPRQKLQKLITETGDGWYTKNITTGLPPIRIPKTK